MFYTTDKSFDFLTMTIANGCSSAFDPTYHYEAYVKLLGSNETAVRILKIPTGHPSGDCADCKDLKVPGA